MRQTEVLLDMLSEDGGPAAFVNLQDRFANSIHLKRNVD